MKGLGQSRLISILEIITGTLVKASAAFIFTQYVAVPYLGISISAGQNLVLTLSITCLSIILSYTTRRVFNGLHIYYYRKDTQ